MKAGGLLTPGTVIASRYEILATLGSGGMGVVYKARDRTVDETVALKVLRPGTGDSPDLVARFRSEVRLAWRVRHRNVCGIHDCGEDGDLLFISMDLIQGRDLKQLLAERPLTWEQAYDIAIQITEGLAAIHEAGVIHRDLKTANIMLDRRGVVRVMDFGIAKVWAEEARPDITAFGQVVGTPDYMSPEQVRGHRVDFRSDQYALGIVIYEVFTGHVPFPAATPKEAMLRRVQEDPALAGPRAAGLPPDLVPVLRKALAREPGDRFASCLEMLASLKAAGAELAARATDSVEAPTPAPDPAADSGDQPTRLVPGLRPSPIAPRLIPSLIRALSNSDPRIRMDAAGKLGLMGPEARAARTALAGLATTDRDERVRATAAAALERLGAEPEPVPVGPAPEPPSLSPEPRPGAEPRAESAPRNTARSRRLSGRFMGAAVVAVAVTLAGLWYQSASAPRVAVSPPPLATQPSPSDSATPISPTPELTPEPTPLPPTMSSRRTTTPGPRIAQATPTAAVPQADPVTPKPAPPTPPPTTVAAEPEPTAPPASTAEAPPATTPPHVAVLVPPVKVSGGECPYPEAARRAHIEGIVTLEIIVDVRGAVSNPKVLSGPPELTAATIACVKKWLYRAGMRDGVPIPFPLDIPVRYDLK